MQKQVFTFGAVVWLLFAGSAVSQPPDLEVGQNILVAKEPTGRVFVEPHIAADPTNSNRLLAIGFVSPTAAERTIDDHCASVFLSVDGGRKWARNDLPGGRCFDPWISVTNKGLAFATVLGTHPGLPDPEPQLLVYVSSDAGETWNDVPQSLGRNHDGTRSIAASDGTFYVLSGQIANDGNNNLRSTAFVGRAMPGRPFVDILPNVFPSNLAFVTDGLAVLSDGALIITYDDFQRKVNGGFRTRAGALKGRRSWAMLSENRGNSFSIPLFITEECWTRPTFLTSDASNGPYRDRLYYLCEGNNQREILLVYSADRGDEWSSAIPVEKAADQDGWRSEPQLAVNDRGILGIAWMDRRDDLSGKCYAPYFAVSEDGGQTFSKPIRVSSDISCPDLERLGSAGRRFNTGGDYFGLTAAADGRFQLLWPDARSGKFELWTATVSVNLRKRGQTIRENKENGITAKVRRPTV